MTERQHLPELEVTPDNLDKWRLAIGSLREKPGLEDITFQLINSVRERARLLSNREEDVFHLYLEESLLWQHIVMEERDKSEGNKGRMNEALQMMQTTTHKAETFRLLQGLDKLEADSLRFHGRVESYKGEHELALWKYQDSKKLFLRMPPDDPRRIRWIEVQGFEAEALIMIGEVDEGLALAKETWELYERLDFDMYTKKVWQSGVPIVTIRALLYSGNTNSLGVKEAKSWLDQAQELLIIPENVETWGDRNFTIRRREIRKLKSQLSALS